MQEAILAQQASTSGIAVENHVIPTPKVFTVDRGYYDALYPIQPAPSINQLIKVQGTNASTLYHILLPYHSLLYVFVYLSSCEIQISEFYEILNP